ncbi:MAG: hypothetical protein V7L05_15850 [Nostoc sp.]|uniref:hypothetical protein n=1 Tax=Nostoc sp. TaxID=1180 RepID=UPI002FF6A4DD
MNEYGSVFNSKINAMPTAGFAYARWKFCRRCLRRASPTLFLTNHRDAEDIEEKESDAFGGLRLRTLEILQAIDRSFYLTQRRKGREEGDRTLEILQAIAFLTNHRDAEEGSDRTLKILQVIAFLSHAKAQRKKRAMPSAGFAYAHWRFCRRCLRRASPTLFLTNHRGAENTEQEESDAFGWLRLRTLEILQAIAFFNEPQRLRGRRERCLRLASPTHNGNFAADRLF